MKVILLTGAPGVGKTTVVTRLCAHYSTLGKSVSGITTREIRENGQRVGFKITDISTKKEGWLARKDHSAGPRIGSYRVVTEDLELIGVSALDHATDGPADIVFVDEIGPMEMTSSSFRNAVSRVLNTQRATVATVKFASHYLEVDKIRDKSTQFEITRDNREETYRKLIEQLDKWTEGVRELTR